LVKLTILNSGRGDMADGAPYRVYLDAVKVHEGQYKLAGGDSLTLQVLANGRTVRLEADLRPYHPEAERKPSITLEGCGNASASMTPRMKHRFLACPFWIVLIPMTSRLVRRE
jgi:hypothetical protein